MKNFLIGLAKFLCAVLILPVVLASILSFYRHLKFYPGNDQDYFIWGAVAFIGIFMFLYQFWGFFEFGQKIVEAMTVFTGRFNKVFAQLVSFYLVLVLVLFKFTVFLVDHKYDPYFIFFIGFTLSMHVLLTAQNLQNAEATPIKPGYLFTINWVILLNFFLIVGALDFIEHKITLGSFTHGVYGLSKAMYYDIIDKCAHFFK